MLKLTKFICLCLLLSIKTNSAWSDGFFGVADPNALHSAMIEKTQNSSAIQNSHYLRKSIQAKVRLRSDNQLSKAQQQLATGNSVVIGDGSTVNGDVIVNIQVNGDTYVAGR